MPRESRSVPKQALGYRFQGAAPLHNCSTLANRRNRIRVIRPDRSPFPQGPPHIS